ncbi:unnamed protein product [Bursaphelenchus xylophilus]|uniref:(pine wood nematode) hypothetical protein n=1 Tax=Bursaphelenchus xylophilus TaxID=6326 RepID=A0A1I7RIC7_BURXY|nr:unnamed protein product [Bursaphelenchus xylophilus]CAG9080937.1 unnamed protein product [Bursaphelenchus xylophilus]
MTAPSSSSTILVERAPDPVDTFEIVETLDALKLSPEKKFMAKAASYDTNFEKFRKYKKSYDEHTKEVKERFREYYQNLRLFAKELGWRTENDWLIEPEYSEYIEPEFYRHYKILTNIYEPLIELDLDGWVLEVRDLLHHRAVAQNMDLKKMTMDGKLVLKKVNSKKIEDSESEDDAACSEEEEAKRERDKQVINTGLDIIRNLFSTTTERLFNELESIPFFDGSDLCYREYTRTFVAFFDHIKRWERFLRVRYNWWLSMSRIMSDAQINGRFDEYFSKFRRYNREASEFCLAKGYVQTLCAHLDECSVDNLKSTIFEELPKHDPVHIQSENLRIVEESVDELEKIFEKLRVLADVDEVADENLKVDINEGLKIAIKEVYMRFLKLKLLTRRSRIIIDARSWGKSERPELYDRWYKWALSDDLDLEKMPPIETLETEKYLLLKAQNGTFVYKKLAAKVAQYSQDAFKCYDMLKSPEKYQPWTESAME